MIKSIWPELHVEVRAKKEGTNCVRKSTVSSFNRSILTRVVGSCWVNFVSFLVEEISNFGMVKEFAALVQMDVLVIALWVVLGKEMREPLQRRSFRDASVSVFHAGKVISD